MLCFGLVLLIAGYLSMPYGGVTKIGASAAWGLYSAAICTIIYPFIYWLVDVQGIKKWSGMFKPAGTNPLLTYILPSYLFAIVGYGIVPSSIRVGAVGFIWAIAFSILILWLAKLLTRSGIRLQL